MKFFLVKQMHKMWIMGIYLKNDVLVSITEGWSERVGRVRRRGPVEDNGSLADAQRTRHVLPLAVRRYANRTAGLHQRVGIRPVINI